MCLGTLRPEVVENQCPAAFAFLIVYFKPPVDIERCHGTSFPPQIKSCDWQFYAAESSRAIVAMKIRSDIVKRFHVSSSVVVLSPRDLAVREQAGTAEDNEAT